MRAGDLLGRHDGAAVRRRLLPVLPEEVRVYLLPRWRRALLPAWVAAVTMPWGIYIRRDLLEGDPDDLGRLLVHELVHYRQWRTHGPFGFLHRYVADYLRGRLRRLGHREAYRRIRFEIEADRVARAESGVW